MGPAKAKAVHVPRKLREKMRANRTRVMDLFKQWDKDESGLVSRDEFARGLSKSGVQLRDADVTLLFDFFDVDGSGTIDFYEMNEQLRVGHNDEDPETLRRAGGNGAPISSWGGQQKGEALRSLSFRCGNPPYYSRPCCVMFLLLHQAHSTSIPSPTRTSGAADGAPQFQLALWRSACPTTSRPACRHADDSRADSAADTWRAERAG